MNAPRPGCWRTLLGGLLLGAMLCAAGVAQAETPGEVIIYLANETAPVGEEAANYDTIIAWLNSQPSAKTEKIVRSLALDREQFAAVVDVETSQFEVEVPKQPRVAGLLIATNGLVRGGQCLLWKPGEPHVRATDIPLASDHEHFILAANPLSRAEVLAELLSLAADHFPPGAHRFVLILKSHGSGTKVITPRLSVRADETNRDELLRIANNELDSSELPLWTDRLGVTKAAFLDLLRQAGEDQGMHFPLVFLEACNAPQHGFMPGDLPENVDALLTVARRVNYQNVLYADVLQEQDEAGTFAAALLAGLSDKFQLVERRGHGPAAWYRQRYVYFIPLLLWIAWVAWRWKRRAAGPGALATGPADGNRG